MKTNCLICGELFTQTNPEYCSSKHRTCYNREYSATYKRKKYTRLKPKLDFISYDTLKITDPNKCVFCDKIFTKESPKYSMHMHKNCYGKNHWRKNRNPNTKMYYKPESIVIDYELRSYRPTPRFNSKSTIEEIKIIEEERQKHLEQLAKFKDRMVRNVGWANLADCYTLIHLFDIYYSKTSVFLESKEMEVQLIYMWNWLKTYEYKPYINTINASGGA